MLNRIMYSGGAKGTEALFSEMAARYEMEQVNFSFEGHVDHCQTGVRKLTSEELKNGDVSLMYVSKIMDRKYPNTPLFKKILQSIWHHVMAGDEVFVVGWILENDHVRGGTGWGAELAKICNKPVHVFDQEKDGWFSWVGGSWEPIAPPTINELHFTGTGTRFLEANGRAAIESLFARSFPR